jgi:hypothetical protein
MPRFIPNTGGRLLPRGGSAIPITGGGLGIPFGGGRAARGRSGSPVGGCCIPFGGGNAALPIIGC